MNVVRKMESVTPEEFEAMEKDEHFPCFLIKPSPLTMNIPISPMSTAGCVRTSTS